MTKDEILKWLEGEIHGYPERATGNECEDYIARVARRMVQTDRLQLVEAMRHWILERGKWTLLAVRIAAEHQLCEIKPEVERLLEDVQAGKAFSPYYEEILISALKRIETP